MSLSPAPHNVIDNRLLAALSSQEYACLLPHLQRVHLPQGKILSDAGDLLQHAYFPLGG